jgi:hypothetical protein
MKKVFFFVSVFSFFSFSAETNSTSQKLLENNLLFENNEISEIYNLINFEENLPNVEVFSLALNGFNSLLNEGKIQNSILTIIDFSISANKERMWVIDLKSKKVLFNTLVAHGRNTGEEFANSFSNEISSYKSSLGFYLTNELYQGKHGLSLRLDGLEKGINDNARERAIVMHGADYVSHEFVAANGRLGRSLGCPAVPENLNTDIVKTIQGKSLLFIYHNSNEYIAQSTVLNSGNSI